jgi:hypothetical protein
MIRETIVGYISTIDQLISTLLVNVTLQQKKKTPFKSKNYWKRLNVLSSPPHRNYPLDNQVAPKLCKQVWFFDKPDPHQHSQCYVLTLPLLFLILHHLFTLLPMRPPTPGTALPWSLTFLTLSLLIPLISYPVLPPNPLPFAPLCADGHILLTTLPSSVPAALMETPRNYGLPFTAILLTLIP